MSTQSAASGTVEMSIEVLLAIVELTKSVLTEAQYAALKAAIKKLALVVCLLQSSKASIKRMRRLFFKETESTSKVLGKIKEKKQEQEPQKEPEKDKVPVPVASAAVASEDQQPKGDKRKSNGGKYAAEDYVGAPRVRIDNPLLANGARNLCPCCREEQKFYHSKLVLHMHFTGAPPVQGTLYELEQARCVECGTVITADPPPEAKERYAPSAIAALAAHHYDAGVPFHAIEKLQAGFGIPLAAGTQFGLLKAAANSVGRAVHNVLTSQAADGSLFYTDDTVMKILQFLQEQRVASLKPFEKDPAKRTGIFTTGIVSVCGEHSIVLYFTGARHAGENLTWLLLQRDESLPPPMLMCDGAHRNVPCLPGSPEAHKLLETVDLQCNAHYPEPAVIRRT